MTTAVAVAMLGGSWALTTNGETDSPEPRITDAAEGNLLLPGMQHDSICIFGPVFDVGLAVVLRPFNNILTDLVYVPDFESLGEDCAYGGAGFVGVSVFNGVCVADSFDCWYTFTGFCAPCGIGAHDSTSDESTMFADFERLKLPDKLADVEAAKESGDMEALDSALQDYLDTMERARLLL